MPDGAFFVAAALPGETVAPSALAVARDRSPSGLAFQPRAHLMWESGDGRVVVGAWQADDLGHWAETSKGVIACVGCVRLAGANWPTRSQWARSMASALEDRSLRELAPMLRGSFAIAAFDASGRGSIVVDPVSFRLLYFARTDTELVVSTRAELVACAIGRRDRDELRAAWLANGPFAVGQRSGYDLVSLLPPGSSIEFTGDEAPSIERSGVERVPATANDASIHELVDTVWEEVAEALRATLSLPVDEHLFGLTGGKDSRLLLSVALGEGLTDGFTFVTTGPPGLADVVVASALAEQFGLRHEVRFPVVPPQASYAARIRRYVSDTAGMSNIWELRERAETEPAIMVSGLVGEFLRQFVRHPARVDTREHLLRVLRKRPWSKLKLLTDEAAAAFQAEAELELERGEGPPMEPLDVLHDFYLCNRVRFARHGVLEEVTPRLRSEPLYSPAVLQAGFSIGALARSHERLHFEITRRGSESLARAPFVGPGWSDELLAQVENADDYRGASDVERAQASVKPEAVRARMQRRNFETRMETFREISADASNPAWNVIDRSRVLDALTRYDTLPTGAQYELYGAITAALWLG